MVYTHPVGMFTATGLFFCDKSANRKHPTQHVLYLHKEKDPRKYNLTTNKTKEKNEKTQHVLDFQEINCVTTKSESHQHQQNQKN